MLTKKNSDVKDQFGKTIGFNSFNTRIEEMLTRSSFKKPWLEGRRFVTPVLGFRERANMDEAPKEYKNREYNIYFNEPQLFAGIHETWQNKFGERIDSCSIITMSSEGCKKIRGIYHERIPIILTRDQFEEWLDIKAAPSRALEMCRLFSDDNFYIQEINKPKTQVSLFD